jgi:hypothetical protein
MKIAAPDLVVPLAFELVAVGLVRRVVARSAQEGR